MSGGFFRGTSADQDTRFSNKEAKLLKSQKFPAELDQLVDMSKVKMDVIRPWIANRTTEFLGFEDEVLINFIYGLLDGKEVDGKQIQIQLTGFMEKNTGKFMKELWSLLTSAQKNASGIPQQFLDAKAEETRKKKAETDRINYEIQKKKEQEEREAEQERQNRINSDLEMAKVAVAASVSAKASSGKGSLKSNLEDEKDERRTSHARDRNGDARLSRDGDHSSQSHRSPPLLRRHRSRSLSRSPRHRRHSPSPIRRHRSPVYSPPRRKRSPLYARSPRRRSPSPWRRRPPSPRRRRSPSPPRRRRSPSPPLRRRSPSPPLRRRSPSPLPRRRSPSPLPKRSPSLPPRRRSPSPPPRRRRSPSPLPRRISPSSPPRRRSPSPLPSMRSPSPPPRRRSPSPPVRLRSPVPRSPRYRRRSPARSPRQRQMDSQSPRRQKSSKSRSPQYRSNRSLSREHSNRYSEVETRRYREKNASERNRPKRDREYLDREEIEYERHEHPRAGGKAIVESPLSHENSPIRACAPQYDLRIRGGRPSHMQDSPPPNESSPSQSPSRQRASKTHMNEEKRYSRRMSPYRRQVGSTHDRGNPRESPEPRKVAEHNTRIVGNIDRKVDRVEVPKRRDARAPHVSETKEYGPKRAGHDRDSPIDVPHNRSAEKRIHCEVSEPKRKEYHTYSSDNVDRSFAYPQRRQDIDMHYASEEIEYGPGRLDHGHPLPDYHQDSHSGQNRVGTVLRSHIEYDDEEDAVELNRSPSKDIYADDYSDGGKIDVVRKPIPKPESIKQTVHSGSDSEESEGYRRKHAEKRKAKREEVTSKYDDEDVSMSPRSSEEKREAKRRKKEEKRLRKEEKRRRREERHRRKEERRANKAKAKGVATVAQPEKDYSAGDDSEDNGRDMDHSHQSQDEEMEDEQKRLEIELRRKALESLRAKKAISQ